MRYVIFLTKLLCMYVCTQVSICACMTVSSIPQFNLACVTHNSLQPDSPETEGQAVGMPVFVYFIIHGF